MRPDVSSVASWIRFEPSSLSFPLCLSLGPQGEEGRQKLPCGSPLSLCLSLGSYLLFLNHITFVVLALKEIFRISPPSIALSALCLLLSCFYPFSSISSSIFSFYIPVSYLLCHLGWLRLPSLLILMFLFSHLSNISTFLLVHSFAFTFCQLSDAFFFFFSFQLILLPPAFSLYSP